MMSRTLSPPPTNVDAAAAAAAAAAANASAITMSPGSMPVTAIGLKLIGAMITNVVASNRGGSSAAQKAVNANTKKGLGRFIQLNSLVKLRLCPAHSTCRV
jgi:hypothetical protein